MHPLLFLCLVAAAPPEASPPDRTPSVDSQEGARQHSWETEFRHDLADLKVSVYYATPKLVYPMLGKAGARFFAAAVEKYGRERVIAELTKAIGDPETVAQAHLLLVEHALIKTYSKRHQKDSRGNYFGLRYKSKVDSPDYFEVVNAVEQANSLEDRWRSWLSRPERKGNDFFPLPPIEPGSALDKVLDQAGEAKPVEDDGGGPEDIEESE